MGNGIKKIAWAFGLFFLLINLSINKAQAHPDRGISLQVFYDELANYGDWINNPDYGYVWRPNVGNDFRPYYTNGHWVMTEYGNTWVSDYEWGWAPFHYGRWFYDSYDGWIWTPDTEWGPAWVTWRTGGGYYGWAPLAPRISININIGRRHFVPNNYWVFIPQRCIYYPSYSRYWEPRRNVYIINNTTIINNVYTNRNVNYYSGPNRDEVRRATRQDVPVYRVADCTRPSSDRISRDAVNIYRPDVSRGENSAPRNIASNSSRPSRADNYTNRTTDGNASSRPDVNRGSSSSRTENGSSVNTDSRPSRSDNTSGSTSNRPDVNRGSTTAPRTENGNSTNTDSRPSRSENPYGNTNREATPSSKVERTESNQPSRTERSAPSQPAPASRTESNSSSRPERSAPSNSAPTRSVERSQPSPQPSSSSSRGGSSSSSSGRPSRGGN